MDESQEFSPEYPLGGTVEPYDIETEKRLTDDVQEEVIVDDPWIRQHDKAQMRSVVVKVEGGIRNELYVNGVRVTNTFSKRPYQLGQGCDGTIDTCVHALLIDYCEKHNLNYGDLYFEAYPPKDESDRRLADAQHLEELKRQAIREGVAYPKRWTKKAFEGLVESLTEINNHSLVGVLCERTGN